GGGSAMTFEELLDQAIAMLERRGRVTYRALKRQFQLDDDVLEDLTVEIIKARRLAVDEDGDVLVWTGTVASVGRSPTPAQEPARAPHAYTPPHLVEKILTSKSAIEGERKQGTVLFADLRGSMVGAMATDSTMTNPPSGRPPTLAAGMDRPRLPGGIGLPAGTLRLRRAWSRSPPWARCPSRGCPRPWRCVSWWAPARPARAC